MSKYKMQDGTVVNTDKAQQSWNEDTQWNGNNHISVATGSQWEHQRLHRSAKGRYYVESWSQWQGSTPSAEYVSDIDAAAWLLANDHELPADLEKAAAQVEE